MTRESQFGGATRTGTDDRPPLVRDGDPVEIRGAARLRAAPPAGRPASCAAVSTRFRGGPVPATESPVRGSCPAAQLPGFGWRGRLGPAPAVGASAHGRHRPGWADGVGRCDRRAVRGCGSRVQHRIVQGGTVSRRAEGAHRGDTPRSVRLGAWVSSTRTRRDRPSTAARAARHARGGMGGDGLSR